MKYILIIFALILLMGSASAAIPTNYKAYFDFEEGSGTTANNANSSYVDMAVKGIDVWNVSGAVLFNGTDVGGGTGYSFGRIVDGTTVDMTGNDMTIVIIASGGAETETTKRFVTKKNSYEIQLANGYPKFTVYNASSSKYVQGPTSLGYTDTHLMGFRYNGTYISIFVDGVQVASAPHTGNIVNVADSLVVGGYTSAAGTSVLYPDRVIIHDMWIYDYAVADMTVFSEEPGGGTSINITAYSPSGTTQNIYNGSSKLFSVNTSANGNVQWLVNGTLSETDSNITTCTFNYTPSAIGSYNITAKTTDDSQTWILNTHVSPTIRVYDWDSENSSCFVKIDIINTYFTGNWSFSVGNTTEGGLYSLVYGSNQTVLTSSVAGASNATIDYGPLYTNTYWIVEDAPILISSYSPADTTPSAINGSIIPFSANLSSSGFWEALVNGTVSTNGTGTTASYNYTASSIGDKNVTIRTTDDQQTWILSIAPNDFATISPTDTTPSGTVNTSKTFTVTLENPANVYWYRNGSLNQTNTSVTSCSYIINSSTNGTFNITAISADDTQTWILTISDASGILGFINVPAVAVTVVIAAGGAIGASVIGKWYRKRRK